MKKPFLNYRVNLLCLLAALFFSADAVMAQSGGQSPRKTIVKNSDHLAFVDRADGNLILTVELISDFTDDTAGVPPDKDLVWVMFDINKNKKVDPRIDLNFGVEGKEPKLCVQFLYSGQASSNCGARATEATVEVKFTGTPAQSRPHPVFIFTFPEREVMPDGKGVNLNLRIHSAGVGSTNYPEKDVLDAFYSLSRTISVRY